MRVFFSGVAFPTCISVNNCVCHFSPLKSDPDTVLKKDDLVKMLVYSLFTRYNHEFLTENE
jgi:methionine aminopeptidase